MAEPENKVGEKIDRLVGDASAEVPGSAGQSGAPGNPAGTGSIPGETPGPDAARRREEMRKLVNDGLETLENIYVQALQHRLERAGVPTADALKTAKRGLATGPLRNRMPDYLAEGIEEMLAIHQIDWRTGLLVCGGSMALQMGPHWLLVNREVQSMEKAKPVEAATDGPVN